MVSEFDGETFVTQISEDHKPDVAQEQARIEASGGRVAKKGETGPSRIWNKKMTAPGLAMSRSLGDIYAHSLGCSSEADIYTQTLMGHDKMLILGTDGIFQHLSNEKVSDIALPFFEKYEARDSEKYANQAALAIVEEANQAWRSIDPNGAIDDCTAIVIFLKHFEL